MNQISIVLTRSRRLTRRLTQFVATLAAFQLSKPHQRKRETHYYLLVIPIIPTKEKIASCRYDGSKRKIQDQENVDDPAKASFPSHRGPTSTIPQDYKMTGIGRFVSICLNYLLLHLTILETFFVTCTRVHIYSFPSFNSSRTHTCQSAVIRAIHQ